MIEKKTLVTALSGVLIGGFLLSGGLAIAGDTKDSVTNTLANKMPFFGQMKHQGGMMAGRGQFGADKTGLSKAALDQLVEDAVITQDKADEIIAYIEERKSLLDKKTEDQGTTPAGRQDLFTQLVTNNILTQEQADTIKSKLSEAAQAQNQQRISDSLKVLVEKGTITQDQSDKILKQCEDAQKEQEDLFNKMESMTPEERRQYMQDNKAKPQNPLAQLVTDGVITQEQADAFQTTMREAAQKQNQQRTADSLQALVDKGTITQDQANNIMAKLDNIQKPQDPVSQLVADGTITQEQADAIGEVVPFNKGHRGGRR